MVGTARRARLCAPYEIYLSAFSFSAAWMAK
jgi:hypothetical protein